MLSSSMIHDAVDFVTQQLKINGFVINCLLLWFILYGLSKFSLHFEHKMFFYSIFLKIGRRISFRHSRSQKPFPSMYSYH